MANEKNKSQTKKVNIDLGNTIRKPSNNLKPITDKTKKNKAMADHKKLNKDNSNIGKNTRWDSPLKESKNGATIPKPSISLKPKRDSEK